MSWGSPNPKKEGWYIVTLDNGFANRIVMPLYRMEYPPKNFTWQGNQGGRVLASIKFPSPYKGD